MSSGIHRCANFWRKNTGNLSAILCLRALESVPIQKGLRRGLQISETVCFLISTRWVLFYGESHPLDNDIQVLEVFDRTPKLQQN